MQALLFVCNYNQYNQEKFLEVASTPFHAEGV